MTRITALTNVKEFIYTYSISILDVNLVWFRNVIRKLYLADVLKWYFLYFIKNCRGI